MTKTRYIPELFSPTRQTIPWWNHGTRWPAIHPRWSRCGWGRLTSRLQTTKVRRTLDVGLSAFEREDGGEGHTWQILLSSRANSIINIWLSTSGSFFSSFTRLRESWSKEIEYDKKKIWLDAYFGASKYRLLYENNRPLPWVGFWAFWPAQLGTAGTPSSCWQLSSEGDALWYSNEKLERAGTYSFKSWSWSAADWAPFTPTNRW